MINQLYVLFLKMHPLSFRALFEDEMRGVFQQGLNDAQHQGNTLLFCVMEFVGVLMSLLRERNLQFKRIDYNTSTRFVLRLSCLFLAMFYLGMNKAIFGMSMAYVVFVFFNMISLAGIVIAFRWERLGGIIAVVGTIPIAFWLSGGVFTSIESFPHTLIVTAFYCFPYIYAGLGFIYLSYRTKRKLKYDA